MLFGGGSLLSIVAVTTTLIIAITVHEFAHAIIADALGDSTPRMQGRVSLNPLRHLDLMGSLLFLIAGFGWGKPVLTNPHNYRTGVRTGMAIVAGAGPLSNLLMAVLAAWPMRFGFIESQTVAAFIQLFVLLNLLLMLFNLIPIPPLDGYKVVLGLLPQNLALSFSRLERIGPLLLLALIFLGNSRLNIFGLLVGTPARAIASALLGA